ncbi:MAG TPA: PspA/IM30 family protein [Terriglobales bacterium]|jgi:phage shock protein A|nr:PspA/IM30 family protein [Terriglobales bacterium]
MALLERVSTLIRANLNDLVDKAEDPEKMIKQVILDMQNQLIQVKTQVAIALADQHLLEKKLKETQDLDADWMRRAELAVDKKQDDLAKAAIDRSLSYKVLSDNYKQQVADQKIEVENLKSALQKLEQKLSEAQAKADLLVAQHRRSRVLGKARDAQIAASNSANSGTFDRMKRKVSHEEAVAQAKGEIAGDDSLSDKLVALEKEDKINQLLAEMKERKSKATV